jgi:hypothetical protein
METQEREPRTVDVPERASQPRASGHAIYLLYRFRVAERRPKPRPRSILNRLRIDKSSMDGEPLARPSVSLKTLIEAPWQPKITNELRQKAEDIQRAAEAKGRKSDRQSEERPANAERGKEPAQDNIWCEADWAVATDMDPQVARLLSQRHVNGASQDIMPGSPAKVWALSPQNNIRDSLMGRAELARYLKPALAIKFSRASIKRMEARLGAEAPKSVVAELGEVRALAFRTGHGLLVTELRILAANRSAAIALPVLVESVVALCGDRHLAWLAPDGGEFGVRAGKDGLKLCDMLDTLLGDYAKEQMATARLFTYTFVKLDAALDPAERQRLMVQLAGKYTDDYRIDPSAFDERIYQPFESVSHLAALEGAVTIVEDAPSENRTRADFLANFGANAVEPRYLPVVVLAYHAFLVLLNLTQESRRWIDLGTPSSRDADRLRRLRDRILEFRLFHRLSHVSLLTMLNEFHHCLSRAFELERMLTTADRDVAEIGALLDARLRQAEAQGSAWFRRLTATSLAIVAGSTVARIIVQALPHIPVGWVRDNAAWAAVVAQWIHDIGPPDTAAGTLNTAVGTLIELVAAVGFGYLAWRWSEGHEVEQHVKDELIVHMRRELND